MNSLQKLGGIAALLEVAAFAFGFWLYFTLLGPARYGAPDVETTRHVAFLAQHQALLSVWNLAIYIGFGAVLVVLAVALHARTRMGSPDLSSVAAGFGLIWAGLVIASGMIANIGMEVIVDLHGRDPAQAASAWIPYKFVMGGLGGGNEIVGGLWVLLVSIAGWRSRALPRLLNGLGIIVSLAGLLTTVPGLESLGEIFGLGLILWFALLGIVMLVSRAPQAE